MEKVDSRYKEFIIRYKKTEQFREEIFRMYEEEYQETFENILLTKQEEFLSTLFKHIKLLIADKYSPKCFKHSDFIALLSKLEKKYQQMYLEDMKTITTLLKGVNKNSHIEHGDKFIFLKHCKFQDEVPIHCCNKANNFYILKIDKVKKTEYRVRKTTEIYGVLCTNCMKIYKANYIKLFCNFDSINYFTKIMEKESEDENIQPATWEKYHCHLIINQQMQCIKCKNNLFFKLKENKLYCPKCQFLSDPTMILWTCIKCGQEFTTNAKIYNPYEYKPISIAIKNAIFNQELAIPESCPCKDHKNTNYTHKKECNGRLYITFLHDRKMVICEKCKAMTKYNKFIWCCPVCQVKFRDDGTQNENFHINEDKNNNKISSKNKKNNNFGNNSINSNDFYDVTLASNTKENEHLELYKLKKNIASYKSKKEINNQFNTNKIVDLPIFDKSNYDIISELNEGKKSKVYCVKNEDNKFFAMKVKEIQNEDENEYFTEKYKLQFNLNNKFFVQLYGLCRDSSGESLTTLFDLGINNWQSEINSMKKATKTYSESLLVSIIYQICNGLQDLYIKGFLHLNINPHNIIIFNDSIYKISDCEMSIDYETLLNDFKGDEHQLTEDEILGILDSGNKYVSPKFKLMIKNRISLNVDNLDKNDVYSLGMCVLSTMSQQKDDKIIINELVYLSAKFYNEIFHDSSNNYIKEKVNFYAKNLGYSQKFLNLLYNMLNVNDFKRFSFKQVIDYITNEYNL